MSPAPPGVNLPPFEAWPVPAAEDATVFLYRDDLTALAGTGIPDTSNDFQTAKDFLSTSASPPEVQAEGEMRPRPLTVVSTAMPVPPGALSLPPAWGGLPPAAGGHTFKASGALRVGGPRMSHAGEARLRLVQDPKVPPDPKDPLLNHTRTARALACRADRGRAVSITLRSVGGATEVTPPSGPPKVSAFDAGAPTPPWAASQLPELFEPKFAASEKRTTKIGPFWFSVADQVEVLYQAIFASGGGAGRAAQGLVVVTGATNSAKTQITLGLIHKYLADRKTYDKRRPHLVTFEDPIEAPLYGPLKEDDLGPAVGAGRLGAFGVSANAPAYSAWLNGLPRPLVAQWHGYDYTPRERGADVRDLAQGFGDALRQTPAVYYVGEVRDVTDWPAVLEFAGTGHLVVTTAHAGSLLEAMMKILNAAGADTAADRRRFASRIKAVVHLRPWVAAPGATTPAAAPSLAEYATLLLPTVWRKTDAGLAALSTNGFGAVMPESPPAANLLRTSCLGRRWFARELAEYVRATDGLEGGWTRRDRDGAVTWAPTDPEIRSIRQTIDRWAARADLNRE